jgi:integration host factor subunit alpha
MTKADIVQAVYTRLGGFSKKESADLVDLVFETMKETLGRGEKIKISGFGNFVLRDKRQRQGRNPQTGEPIVITERRVLNFKASQLLKQALNDERGDAPRPGELSVVASLSSAESLGDRTAEE